MAPPSEVAPREHSKLTSETLTRTVSDISVSLMRLESPSKFDQINDNLPPISEVENVKCECCGMSEDCTPKYVKRVRDRFLGRMVCGICSEAIMEEMKKNGGIRDEAVRAHFSTCASFNRLSRTYPVLCQAEAMREMLRKNRAKSLSPRDKNATNQKISRIARSSSCMPAITRESTIQTLFK